jgi:hypothetical protein
MSKRETIKMKLWADLARLGNAHLPYADKAMAEFDKTFPSKIEKQVFNEVLDKVKKAKFNIT